MKYSHLILITSVSLCGLMKPVYGMTPHDQAAPLTIKAVLVLTPEFCATQFKKGDWVSGKETFLVGKAACAELEPALKSSFPNLTVASVMPSPGDSQLVLVPRFVDAGATRTMGAFSNREMDVFLEWTVKDAAGKTLWFETVEGSAKHHSGNAFTYKKSLQAIVEESVKDAAAQSASKMRSSPELHKLSQ